MNNFIVALDGPAGSGKSTIAKMLAKKYNLTYLDTGAMYRMVSLDILNKKLDYTKEELVEENLKDIKLDIIDNKFILNGIDVSLDIRTPEVSNLVSKVSAIKSVRKAMVKLQREISNGKDVILDGRDIGTIVFPNADLKIFLVASAEERAKRRKKEFDEKGIDITYDEVLKNILERDHIDSTREEGPLKKAEDAIEIDSSNLTIEECCNKISELIEEKR